MLPAAAFNFRDLGGIGTADGRRVRSGRVFRSNGLFDLSDDEVGVLQARCRLRTVIDLRGPLEARRERPCPLAGGGLRSVRLPLLDEERQAPGVLTDFLPRYQGYLATAGDRITQALEVIADEASQPVLFHCTTGRDRTGVLAALLLDCLGVPADAIVADYGATRADRALLVEFLRRRPGRADLPDGSPLLDTDATVMAAFLDWLQHEHGGAAAWARSAGLDPAVLNRLRKTLLE